VQGEEVTHWLKIVEVSLIASVKFLLAPFEAERYNMSYWESFLYTTGGGIMGIFVFYYAGHFISEWWKRNMAKIKSFVTRRPITDFTGENRRIMTRKNKLIVRVKNKFGLAGIAFVTPCLISIPIGTLVAVAIYRKRKPVILYLLISLVLWSLFLNWLAQYLALSERIREVIESNG
jgi:hypothetical protein